MVVVVGGPILGAEYEPERETGGMFTRVGIANSIDTLIYAENRENHKRLSLRSQIERYSTASTQNPTFRRPALMNTGQKPKCVENIVILGWG